METTQAPLDAPKAIRIGRLQLSLNVVVQACVIVAIVAMANYLSFRHYKRFDWSRSQKFALSKQTKLLLNGLPEKKPIQAIVFFAGEGEAEADCRLLLREYAFASNGKITVEEVSPFLNLTRAKELANKYKFGANENIVILDYDGKSKFINSAEMGEFEQLDQIAMMMGRRPTMEAFKGEQLLTAALLELTEQKQNKVYLVGGHGEYDFNSDQIKIFKEQLTRQNLKVEALALANLDKVPEDASALVILGPRYEYSERDIKLLTDYWDKKGRLFVATGPTGRNSNLHGWLAGLGVQVMSDSVLRVVNLGGITGMMELSGIIEKGSPITKNLDGVGVMLVGQTQSIKLETAQETIAQVRLTSLMKAPDGYWGETEYVADRSAVPFFDPKKDHAAPLTLAASVEKAAPRDPNVKLDNARMVVFGNGDFLSEDGLRAGPAGLDLATNAFNWLLNRESLIALPPKPKQNVQISLNENQRLSIAKWVSLYIPVAVALFGLYYLWARHGKSLLKLTASVAFAAATCWGLWNFLLWYLGTTEGRQPAWQWLSVLGGAIALGAAALYLESARRKKPAPTQA